MKTKILQYSEVDSEEWDDFVYKNKGGYAYHLYDVIALDRWENDKNKSFAIFDEDRKEIVMIMQLHLEYKKITDNGNSELRARLHSRWGFVYKDGLHRKEFNKLVKGFKEYIDELYKKYNVYIANGKEIYYKLENENINLIDCAEYKDRIEQLRRLAGNYFLNIKEIPEFANALKLYKKEKGNVYWITGLSGAGKTTIGKLLYNRIKDKKDNVIFLDGDVLREVYQTKDYSNEGRLNLALQHGRLCKMLSEQGIDVVICVIAMYDECRQWNHDNIENYHEIYLRVSIDELIRRDQKQLYSRVLKKEISNVMGMDIPFEEPKNPEVIIDNNGNESPEQIINKISEKFDI